MSAAATGSRVTAHGLRFDIAGFSEQGPRTENQDAFSIDHFEGSGVVALADGMGGERSGRLAADTALAAVVAAAPIRSLDDARRAVRTADASVSEAAAGDPNSHGGMGCALGLLSLVGGGSDGVGWVGAHVGDVRILSRSPDGLIRLETRDHTPAFGRWEAGEISLDEIPDTPGANRLQRAVGRGGEADAVWLPARPGWSWLLISDGVYKVMRLDELARAMDGGSAAAAIETIRRKVEERGPEDNFTAVLVRALGDANAPPPPPDTTTLNMEEPARPVVAATPARSGRAGGSVAAILLAVLALAAAGFALWTAWGARSAAADAAEFDRLRIEVDSLRTEMRRLSEPFGPTAGGAVAPLGRDTPTAAPRTPTRP